MKSKAPRKQTSAPPESSFQLALRYLGNRAYSVAELKQKLRRKQIPADAIDETVVRLKQLGFLDDRRLAEHYASSLARNRAFGRFRVERELKARRVDPRAVAPAVEQAFQESDEKALLERALDQKMRGLRLPLTRIRLFSLCASLRRRGFRSDDIMKAVRARAELAPVAEDVDPDALEE
ncbi:MAG TPA: RecX family transcriptional regulator [Terriglobia bacterium]|nr:RecX family transcriptional regulator [Terriglobia bacterium]